jgi:uncharacterized repeat protein (TIGR03899 family)
MTGTIAGGAAQAVSAPLGKLIEVTAAGVAGLYEPIGVRRRAHAEAHALITMARAKMEVTRLEQRAAERLLAREERRLENLDSILKIAASEPASDIPGGSVDQDWMVRFFSACEDVTDEQMQAVWGQLLAREIAQPGSFSRRTLDVVRNLSRQEAHAFNSLCLRSFEFEGSMYPLIFQIPEGENMVVRHEDEEVELPVPGISYPMFQDLEAAGLIHFEPSMIASCEPYHECELRSRFYTLTLKRTGTANDDARTPTQARVSLGLVRLSRCGAELVRIATGKAPLPWEFESAAFRDQGWCASYAAVAGRSQTQNAGSGDDILFGCSNADP